MESPRDDELIFPSLAELVDVNRAQVDKFGGSWTPPDNLKKRDEARGILEYIRNPPVDHASFHGLPNMAGRLARHLITGHYFHDGNKRVGMVAGLAFLIANGLEYDATDEEIEWIGNQIADGESGITLEDVQEWMRQIIVDAEEI